MSAPLVGSTGLMQSPPSLPDRLFAEFQRSGDPGALGEVYDRLAPELLGLAMHLTRDQTEAEDVLQATFVVAIEEAQRFDPDRRVLPWLVGILGNEAKKARERAARRPDPERLEVRREAGPLAAAEGAEVAARLEQDLARVPPAFRPVLRLRLCHGMSVAEIAALLERAPGTVRSQLARGTESLRRALPAGFAAGLLACSRPTRGLATVRTAVVEHASLHAAATVGSLSAATVLGGLAMKKLAALAFVLISALVLWSARGTSSRVEELALAAPALEAPPRDPPDAQAGPWAGPQASQAQREAVPATPQPEPAEDRPASTDTAELLVHASWPDGRPAANEVVLLASVKGRPDEALPLSTGADGSVRFQDLEPGWANVRLLRGGEASVLLRAGATEEVRLGITEGVTLDVRVRDEHGEPVAAAEVWLSERYRNNIGHVIGHTDARGAFTLRSLESEHYLGAQKRGYAPSALRGARGSSGDRLELELVLAATGASLRGLVVDDAGESIPGAWLLVGRENPESVRLEDGTFAPSAPPLRLRADEEGRFECAMVAPGLQPLQARAPGFAPCLASLEVFAGAANECRITLEPEARLVGRVRMEDGEPLSATWIRVGGSELFASASTWSDAEGRFRLGGLGRGRQLARASHARHGQVERELHLVPGVAEEWQVVLDSTPLIEGRVLSARGEPRADLVLIAMPGGERTQRVRSSRTDGEGRFLLSGLEDRDYLLWVQRPDGWNEFPLLEVEDVWPADTELVLRLPDQHESGRITLEVTSADGTPLGGTELLAWHVERKLWRTFVSGGETGAIQAENVPPGTLQLELRHPQHPWKLLGERYLESGQVLDLGRIALEPSGSLRARLRGLTDERTAALSAMLTDASNHERGVARITPGLLTLGPLAAGEYLLILGGEGICQVRRSFAIEVGRETELELFLEECGVRIVHLPLPEGVPPKWIACSLHDGAGTLVWGGSADCTKDPPEVRISAAAGTYRLVVGGPGSLRGEGELLQPAAGATLPPLVLRLAR